MRKLVPLGAIVLSAALAACSGRSPAALEVGVTARDFAFEPATIQVTAGQTVRLTLTNAGSVEHDLSVMEIPLEQLTAAATPMEGHEMGAVAPELHVAVQAGQSATIEFTATRPGTYEFLCAVPGHKDAGMVGTLTVLAP